MTFILTKEYVKESLNTLAKHDLALAKAIDRVGYPGERRRGHGFSSLLRIIIGQQLSVKAAATIAARVEAAIGDENPAQNLASLSDDDMRALGMSRQKVVYCRGLCETYLSGNLRIDQWPSLDDDIVLDELTSLKGFGRWSAEMYLMFSLGRTDIWPADDLAVQEAVKRLEGLDERPKPKQMDMIAEKWRPHRSSMALFLWHYYAKTPAL